MLDGYGVHNAVMFLQTEVADRPDRLGVWCTVILSSETIFTGAPGVAKCARPVGQSGRCRPSPGRSCLEMISNMLGYHLGLK